MIRTTMFVSAAALALAVVTGCDKAADDQQKADNAQAQANQKIATANQDSTTKTTSAQVEADKTIANAQQDYAKKLENYRHSVQSDLVDVDKKIDTLNAKDKTLTGKKKADLDANLSTIRSRRAAFDQDVSAITQATAVQFDNLKDKTDKDLSDLKSAVNDAN